MVKREYYRTREDGVNLHRTYSDKGLKIRKLEKDWMGNMVGTNEVYGEAIDVENAPYEYEETDIPIDDEE